MVAGVFASGAVFGVAGFAAHGSDFACGVMWVSVWGCVFFDFQGGKGVKAGFYGEWGEKIALIGSFPEALGASGFFVS